jgi:hypothetical protein
MRNEAVAPSEMKQRLSTRGRACTLHVNTNKKAAVGRLQSDISNMRYEREK